MMHSVLFDLIATQPSPEAQFHGGGEYAKFIFLEAVKSRKFDCIYNPDLILDPEIERLCIKHNIKKYKAVGLDDIEKIIIDNNYGFFYSAIPYYYGNLNMQNCHFIMTIHGLRDIECPNDETEIMYRTGVVSVLKLKIRNLFFKERKEKRSYNGVNKLLSLKKKTIITDSEHSKYSILSFFPKLEKNSIKVIYAPYKVLSSPKVNFKYEDIKNQYYLLISGNRWIKNNYRAIRAFDRLFSEGKLKEKKVVVIGVKNMTKLQNVINLKNFIFIDYLSEKEFSWFFKNAYCFVYPSLNEGYGYPPLHAMSYGVPVIASAITSIPEVCSNSVLYFNPFSIDEIKNRILQINDNSKLYIDLKEKGINRLKYILEKQKDINKDILRTIFDN